MTPFFGLVLLASISMSSGFLNKIQLRYTKYILGSPDIAEDIKDSTRQILIENYQPWLRNQYKSFVRQNAKTMNRVYVRELYQYAIYGLLESLQAFNGSVGLHKYATKFVYGQMYKGINDLAIMKPLKLHEAKRGVRALSAQLVPPDEYWRIEQIAEDNIENMEPSNIVKIKEIMKSSPGEYRRLFYLRYDYNRLSVIRPIADICQMEAYSEETYRKKMKSVIQYITDELRNKYGK